MIANSGTSLPPKEERRNEGIATPVVCYLKMCRMEYPNYSLLNGLDRSATAEMPFNSVSRRRQLDRERHTYLTALTMARDGRQGNADCHHFMMEKKPPTWS
jgi:hypothetical protein